MTDKCPNCGFTVELSPRERRALLCEGRAKDALIKRMQEWVRSNSGLSARYQDWDDFEEIMGSVSEGQTHGT